MFLINATHESSGWRENLIHEDEDGLLGRELDALTDNVNELADGEVGRHQVLLFIDRSDIALLDLLANDLYRDGLLARCLMSTQKRTLFEPSSDKPDQRQQEAVTRGEAYRNAVGVFLTDAFGLGLALLEGVLVLKLASHLGGVCG